MHYVFNLDDTLINSLPGIAISLNGALSEFGLGALPNHTVEEYIGDGSYVLCQRADPSLNDADTQKLDVAFRRRYATE